MRRNVRQQFDHALKAFGIRRSNRSKDNDSCDRYETLLTAYADGELDDKRKQVVEGHLNACADCRASLAATRLSSRALFECPRAPFTGDMSARLRMAIADEARKPVRVPIWTMPRLATAGAAFAAIAAAAFIGIEHLGAPTSVAVKPPTVHAVVSLPTEQAQLPTKPVIIPEPKAQVASNDVASNGASRGGFAAKPVPHAQLSPAFKPVPHDAIVASAKIAAPTEHFVKPVKPVEQMASLPHVSPSVKVEPRIVEPTEMAKLPSETSPDTGLAPTATSVAPSAPVVRAPDDTVASNPAEPHVLSETVDIEPVDQPSLAMRLRHSAHLTDTTGVERVSVSGARYAAATDGTAVLVGSGFYSH